jgi:hypothetical protein
MRDQLRASECPVRRALFVERLFDRFLDERLEPLGLLDERLRLDVIS